MKFASRTVSFKIETNSIHFQMQASKLELGHISVLIIAGTRYLIIAGNRETKESSLFLSFLFISGINYIYNTVILINTNKKQKLQDNSDATCLFL